MYRIFNSKHIRPIVITIILLLTLLSLGGCFWRQPEPTPMDEDLVEITLYFRKFTETEDALALEKRMVADDNLPFRAIEELIVGPKEPELDRLLPPETKINSLEIENSQGNIDFDSRLIEDLNVGASGESLVVTSIVNTLTEFDEIKTVQILIDGETRESLAGHVTINEPLKRNERIIID